MATEYSIQILGRGVTTIEDEGVRCFLFEGTRQALLVDTGHGGGDLRDFVSTLTTLPVRLLNTHADRDHIGGNKAFLPAMLHPAELTRYVSKGGRPHEVELVTEGHTIDLGGRSFVVLHIPGHTPGSIALFDAEHGDLVAGDTVQNGRIFMFGKGRDMPTYLQSLKGLRALPVKRVCCSHGGAVLPPEFITQLYTDAKAVCAGAISSTPVEVFGYTVLQYRGAVGTFLCDGR